jgi:hypothetical protein
MRQCLSRYPDSNIAETRPVSYWDRSVFSKCGYDDSVNPLDWVANIVAHRNFLSAREDALKSKRDVLDLSEIEAWGRNVAEQMGMPVDRMGHFGDWPRVSFPDADQNP